MTRAHREGSGITHAMHPSWKLQHTVESQWSRDFGWQFWTHVENWATVDSSAEWAKLDSPFSPAIRGTTKSRGGDPIELQLTEVVDRGRAVIAVRVFGAVERFLWAFEDSAGGGTRLTQRITMDAEGAAVDGVIHVVPELE